MKETLKNYLILRDTELTLQGIKSYWEVKTSNDALDAWADLSLKVRSSNNREIKQFYLERLEKIHTLVQRHDKVVYDFKKLEVEYQKLFDRYSEQVEVNRNLQKEF